MSNTFLNIVIGLSGILVGVLAFSNEIAKKKYFKFFKKLGFKIFILVIASFAGVLSTIQKDKNSEITSKNEKLQNDSLNIIAIRENNSKLILSFSSALAEHGLKYDSTEKRIYSLIKDSNKKNSEASVISIRAGESGITSDRLSDNKMGMKMIFRNYGENTAYNCNVSIIPITKNNSEIRLNETIKSNDNFTLSTKTQYLLTWDLNTQKSWIKDTLYLYTKGTHTNYEKSDIRYFRELHVYDYQNNIWKIAKRENEKIIYDALKNAKMF
jgi:hypothetical protein